MFKRKMRHDIRPTMINISPWEINIPSILRTKMNTHRGFSSGIKKRQQNRKNISG